MNPGDRLDKYVIQRTLGEGGMATVYLATHEVLESQHALKVLRIDAKEIRARLLAEGKVQSKLNHPNVVQVTDILEGPFGIALVMEYVDGPSLEEVLDTRPLTPTEALEWFKGIALGMAAAHRLGLVHRDLKPGNILLHTTNAGIVPKVTDFGLVKVIETSGTKSGVLMGTPEYMSPEQVRDSANVDQRSDQFALGSLLYEMVTGTPAFDHPDVVAVYTAIVSGDYVPVQVRRPSLSPRVATTVERMLMTDPEERFHDLGEVIELLYPGVPSVREATAPQAHRWGSQEGQIRQVNLLSRTPEHTKSVSGSTQPLPPPRITPPPFVQRRRGALFATTVLVVASLICAGAGTMAYLSAQRGPAERGVVWAIEAQPNAWLQVGDALVTEGSVELDPQPVGSELSATWWVGPGCDACIAPSDCPAWCVQEPVSRIVPEGEGPWTPTLSPPAVARVSLRIEGKGAVAMAVDGESVELQDGIAEAPLLPGPHTVVALWGVCEDDAIGCGDDTPCPEGCVPGEQRVEVLPDGAPGTVRFEAPEVPKPTPSPTPAPAPAPAVSRPVTAAAFAAFVDANPAWGREAATAAGTVDGSYLAGWEDGPPTGVATRIPWAAAKAYCAGRGGLLGLNDAPLTWASSSRARIEWRQVDGGVAWRRFDGVTSTALDPRQSMPFSGFRCNR